MLAGVLRDVLPTHACRQPPALLPAAPQANTERTCSRTPPTPGPPSHAWRASLQEPSTLCCQEKATTFTKSHQRPGWVHTPPWCWQSHQGADCLGRQGGSHLLVLQGSQLAPASQEGPRESMHHPAGLGGGEGAPGSTPEESKTWTLLQTLALSNTKLAGKLPASNSIEANMPQLCMRK